MDSESKISLMRRVLQIMGLSPPPSAPLKKNPAPKGTITDCVKRVDAMEERVRNVEQVTMSWNLNELTEEEKRHIGIGGEE